MNLAPLPIVVPLLTAALLIGLGPFVPRRLLDLISCLAAGAMVVVCGRLTFDSADAPIVYWFGGWQPDGGIPLGIAFVIDPLGAGLATLVATLVFAALVFSWRYFESLGALYHALMLVFLAAMCGMCLTGDFFNLFVWFELMTATGATLCGYKADETGPLQGALNFAVTNTIGAFLSLTGVAILYAQVGALNFAQVAVTLNDNDPGGWFVPVVFLFIIAGFLVKAAAFPFHLWLADAHAVAPTPVCILFSGVMVELGLYATARVYWSVFALPLRDHAVSVTTLFVSIGSISAVYGALACVGQRHLKRLLAFSTISHMGVMLIGFGLLDARALAGTALYVLGHGFVKASLFLVAGILLHRFRSVDEFELKGTGRKLTAIAALMLAGGLGLTGAPPFVNGTGDRLIESGAASAGYSWAFVVLDTASILTGAAVLRAGARIFLGWGQSRDAASRSGPRIDSEQETAGAHWRTPLTMWLPAFVLVAAPLTAGLASGLQGFVREHAARMTQSRALAAYVLEEAPLPKAPAATAETHPAWETRRFLLPLGAVLLALFDLYPGRLSPLFGRSLPRLVRGDMNLVRAMQTGRIGDYVAWFVFGIAGYGVLFLLLAA